MYYFVSFEVLHRFIFILLPLGLAIFFLDSFPFFLLGWTLASLHGFGVGNKRKRGLTRSFNPIEVFIVGYHNDGEALAVTTRITETVDLICPSEI